MTRIHIALTAVLLVAGSAQAQLVEPVPGSALRTTAPPAMQLVPAPSPFYGGIEGLPPADPQAPDLYRADPKIHAGVNLNPNFGIEATFTNPKYREGLHFVDHGPRLAQGAPLGIGGYDFGIAARVTVPVDDKLSAFGTLGAGAKVRAKGGITTTETGPIASVGTTYKLNSKQTATVEIPLGGLLLRNASGANLKLGF